MWNMVARPTPGAPRGARWAGNLRMMTMTGAVVMTATTTMRCRYDDDDVDDDVDGNTLTVADCDED